MAVFRIVREIDIKYTGETIIVVPDGCVIPSEEKRVAFRVSEMERLVRHPPDRNHFDWILECKRTFGNGTRLTEHHQLDVPAVHGETGQKLTFALPIPTMSARERIQQRLNHSV